MIAAHRVGNAIAQLASAGLSGKEHKRHGEQWAVIRKMRRLLDRWADHDYRTCYGAGSGVIESLRLIRSLQPGDVGAAAFALDHLGAAVIASIRDMGLHSHGFCGVIELLAEFLENEGLRHERDGHWYAGAKRFRRAATEQALTETGRRGMSAPTKSSLTMLEQTIRLLTAAELKVYRDSGSYADDGTQRAKQWHRFGDLLAAMHVAPHSIDLAHQLHTALSEEIEKLEQGGCPEISGRELRQALAEYIGPDRAAARWTPDYREPIENGMASIGSDLSAKDRRPS